jgi:outer membrane protein assembly factor BamB
MADGVERWRFSVGDEFGLPGFEATNGPAFAVFGSPIVTEDSVFSGTLSGHLFAVDRQTGQQQWVFRP